MERVVKYVPCQELCGIRLRRGSEQLVSQIPESCRAIECESQVTSTGDSLASYLLQGRWRWSTTLATHRGRPSSPQHQLFRGWIISQIIKARSEM